MCLISLDPGTNFGWAVFYRGRRMRSGTWYLEGKTKLEKEAIKGHPDFDRLWAFPKLMRLLQALIDDCTRRYKTPPVVVYELVMSHGPAGVYAAQKYGGWLACFSLLRTAYLKKVLFEPMHVGTWKRLFVGHGNATKKEYVAAVNAQFGLTLKVTSGEDEAAALGIMGAYLAICRGAT